MDSVPQNHPLDKSNMRQLILDFPGQFRAGLKLAENVKVPGKFKSLLICGVGGSAIPGEIINVWLNDRKIDLPMYINRDYNLPHHTNRDTLVVCISYSGNTEETLSCFRQSIGNGLKIAAITSGGELEELCKKNNIPFALLPKGFQPRMALGLQFAALMKILSNSGVIEDDMRSLLALEKSLKPEELEAQGKALVAKITNKIPVVYASNPMKALAQIWKIKLNENSEVPAFSNYFPELNHNEMVGFTRSNSNLHAIILRNDTDHPRNKKRMELTTELLEKRGFPIDIIEMQGKNILHKFFTSMLLADWASYYLALGLGRDPTPVKIVEELKKKMK